MGHAFDLHSGKISIGDPTMGLARYELSLAPGSYQLSPDALRPIPSPTTTDPDELINLDSPCIFVLDNTHLREFESWYHRVGGECSYMAITIAERISEIESSIGARIAHYWEQEVATHNHEGTYILDVSKVEQIA